jgi:hypothetical protein
VWPLCWLELVIVGNIDAIGEKALCRIVVAVTYRRSQFWL